MLRLHPHVKTMIGPAVAGGLVLAVAIAAIIVLPASIAYAAAFRLVIAAIAVVAAIVWFGLPLLRWRTTSYELTTRRLRMREGILSRTGRDFPLGRISDVSFAQGLLDRVFGCGRLVVESAGEHGQLVLTEIPDVRRVQAVLFELVNDEAARLGRTASSGY